LTEEPSQQHLRESPVPTEEPSQHHLRESPVSAEEPSQQHLRESPVPTEEPSQQHLRESPVPIEEPSQQHLRESPVPTEEPSQQHLRESPVPIEEPSQQHLRKSPVPIEVPSQQHLRESPVPIEEPSQQHLRESPVSAEEPPEQTVEQRLGKSPLPLSDDKTTPEQEATTIPKAQTPSERSEPALHSTETLLSCIPKDQISHASDQTRTVFGKEAFPLVQGDQSTTGATESEPKQHVAHHMHPVFQNLEKDEPTSPSPPSPTSVLENPTPESCESVIKKPPRDLELALESGKSTSEETAEAIAAATPSEESYGHSGPPSAAETPDDQGCQFPIEPENSPVSDDEVVDHKPSWKEPIAEEEEEASEVSSDRNAQAFDPQNMLDSCTTLEGFDMPSDDSRALPRDISSLSQDTSRSSDQPSSGISVQDHVVGPSTTEDSHSQDDSGFILIMEPEDAAHAKALPSEEQHQQKGSHREDEGTDASASITSDVASTLAGHDTMHSSECEEAEVLEPEGLLETPEALRPGIAALRQAEVLTGFASWTSSRQQSSDLPSFGPTDTDAEAELEQLSDFPSRPRSPSPDDSLLKMDLQRKLRFASRPGYEEIDLPDEPQPIADKLSLDEKEFKPFAERIVMSAIFGAAEQIESEEFERSAQETLDQSLHEEELAIDFENEAVKIMKGDIVDTPELEEKALEAELSAEKHLLEMEGELLEGEDFGPEFDDRDDPNILDEPGSSAESLTEQEESYVYLTTRELRRFSLRTTYSHQLLSSRKHLRAPPKRMQIKKRRKNKVHPKQERRRFLAH
ncbi:hypothetical protein BOX15_Mlig025728g1, partial [Macrostomum lignano]